MTFAQMSNYNQNVYYYRFTFLPIKLEDGLKCLKGYGINDHCYWGNMNYVEEFPPSFFRPGFTLETKSWEGQKRKECNDSLVSYGFMKTVFEKKSKRNNFYQAILSCKSWRFYEKNIVP